MTFKRAGAGLAGLLLDFVHDDDGRLSVVRAVWSSVVGRELRSRTEPTGLHDGALTVRVNDERWLAVVRELEHTLRERLDEAFGRRVVDRFEWFGPDGWRRPADQDRRPPAKG